MASLELHRCLGIVVEVSLNVYPFFSEFSIIHLAILNNSEIMQRTLRKTN